MKLRLLKMNSQLKIKEKILDKVKDIIPNTIAKLLTILLSSLSVFTVIAYVKEFLFNSIEIKIWQCILLVFSIVVLSFVLWLIKLKLQSKQKFPEGTNVILKTGRSPVMSAGKYNFFNNKVICTWHADKEIKNELINQNLLKEYQTPVYSPPKKKDSIWTF